MKNVFSIIGAVLLGWFGLSEISRGVSYVLDPTDWSDEYLRMEATIVDSEERQWGSDGPSVVGTAKTVKSASYRCGYVLEIAYEGERYRQKAVWLSEMNETSRGEDCGASRYGEKVPVWVAEGYKSDPSILEVGNRNSRPMMVGFAFLIGLAAIYGSFRLARATWRRWKRPGPAA